jgi:predicted RNA-binding Zn-ribbon protein involved in translation (DUF1610 family)
MKRRVTFETARSIVKALLAVTMIVCLGALLFDRDGEAGFGGVAAVTGLVCVALAIFVVIVRKQCPYCGRRIIRKCLAVKACPHCGRDLVSGLRHKKKKR